MTLKSYAKFKEKPICYFKNDNNLVNFHPSTQKSFHFNFDLRNFTNFDSSTRKSQKWAL